MRQGKLGQMFALYLHESCVLTFKKMILGPKFGKTISKFSKRCLFSAIVIEHLGMSTVDMLGERRAKSSKEVWAALFNVTKAKNKIKKTTMREIERGDKKK